MGAWTLSDGTRTESFYPDHKGYKESDVILGDFTKSYTGKSFNYVYGSIGNWDLSLSYVNSSQRYIFNNWWANRTPLTFTLGIGTDVFTVAIVGAKKPIRNYMQPYLTLYGGTLRLEELS